MDDLIGLIDRFGAMAGCRNGGGGGRLRPPRHRLDGHNWKGRAQGVMLAAAALALPLGPAGPAGGAAVAAGSWAPAPPPARAVNHAVQLSNGSVLAAGMGSCGLAICWELYDPVFNVWAPAGRTESAQVLDIPYVETLTPLVSGGALVFLWEGSSPKDIKKYRYTRSGFIALEPIKNGYAENARNFGHSSTLLDPPLCRQPSPPADYPCGKVLVAGGVNNTRGGVKSDGNEPRTAELYSYNANDDTDPGALFPLAGMPEDRGGHHHHVAALLEDGRVLLMGATGAYKTNPQEVSFFDPRGGPFDPTGSYRMGAWSSAAPLPPNAHTVDGWAVRLLDGRVLTGGARDDPSTKLFDPTAGDLDPGTGKPVGSWTAIASCPGVHTCGVPAVLPGGMILTVGQAGTSAQKPLKAFLLDPADPDPKKWSWTPVAPDPIVPAYTATLLDGGGDTAKCGTSCGNVLVAGGVGTVYASSGAAQIFQLLRVDALSPKVGFACGGGQEVTISGNGFREVATVNFGAVSVPKRSATRPEGFTVNDQGTEIMVVPPRNAPGTVPVSVTTAGGATSAPSPSTTFNYRPSAPATVASLSAKEGPARGGTKVDIRGGFASQCVKSVKFGDIGARDVVVGPAPGPGEPATVITATSPGGLPGQAVRVNVEVDPGLPAAQGTVVPSVPESPEADVFTYLALPAITGIDPAGGSALGGARVTITGSGFEEDGDATPKVFFDGQEASGVTVASDNKTITASLPPLAPGKVPGRNFPVSVSTARRGTSLPFTSFNYHPGVLNISPPSGFITGGESRVITGAGLRDAEVVLIGGQEAKILDRPSDGRSLVVSTPARADPESVPVEVIVAGLASLETVYFNYGDPAGADPPAGDPDAGPALRQGNTPQAAPPGGTGSPAPSPSASAAPSPVPGASAAASGSGAGSSSASSASAQAPTTGSAQSPAGAGAAGAAAAPAPGPAAAPASAAAGTGSAGSGGPAGAGSDDEADEARTMPRHNMTAANVALGLGGGGAAMCFSGLALARRRRSARSRPRPRGAY